MKIGFVFDDSLDKPDGIQQYMLSLQQWLTMQGHEVHFLVGQTKRSDIPNVHSLSRNVNVAFNGNSLSIPILGSKRRIQQVFADHAFDVLHVSLPYHPYMAGWVMKLAPKGTVIVGTFHILPYSFIAQLGGKLQNLLMHSSKKRLQSVVSVSAGAQDFAKRLYGIKSTVLPNVFDYQRFATAQPLPAYDDEVLTIFFLGRLVPRKGCMQLLQAVRLLQQNGKKYPAFRVVIAGSGQLEAELKTFARVNNLTNISFVGRISEADKPRYMASADISVFPSSGGESFGIVLLEAMASGRAAVLGGDNPGYRSVLGHKPETLIDAKQPQDLADKLDVLLTNNQMRHGLAEWAAKDSKQYDVTIVGPRLVDLYQSVASNHKKES